MAKGRFSRLAPWLAAALLAGEAQAVDVLLALDRSGSMKINDTRRDSVRGVELFAELLNPEDGLGLLTFAERAEPLLPVTPLTSPKAREGVAEMARRVAMDGILTNFEAALRRAYDEQSRTIHNPGAERIVVLFSDGRIDLGGAAANQAARAAIASELIPKFKTAGIRIHGVAFSPKADLEFLRGLAEATGGQAFRAERPADIYRAFVRLFEEADQPLTAPIENGRVSVDANVRELKLLIGRNSQDQPIQMTDPRGDPIKESDRRPGLEWKRTPQFDRITIQRPEPGAWRVMGDHGEKRAYFASDLDLVAKLPASAPAGEPVTVSAKLTYLGRAITDPAMLKDVEFRAAILDASGNVIGSAVELRDAAVPGRWEARGSLTFAETGAYRVRISAESPAYQRGKILSIAVTPPPATETAALAAPAKEPSPLPAALEASNAQAAIDAPSAEPRARAKEKARSSGFSRLILVNLALVGLSGIGLGIRRLLLRRRAVAAPGEKPRERPPESA